MNLLFERKQTTGRFSRVNFQLWGKIELDEDEESVVKQYRLDDAVLIAAEEPGLIRKTLVVSLVLLVVALLIFIPMLGINIGAPLSLIVAIGIGYWYYHKKRETIFVKDLIHGRHFTCDSVVELARKEAWLETVTAFLRQVMEGAKHWDGTTSHKIEPLAKDEARQVMIRGL